MCGIFGIYGAPQSTDHDKFLKDAMVCGTVRGAHGAGAMKIVIDRKEKSTFSTAYKIAGTGTEFLQDSKASQVLVTSNNVMAVVGHNRYAIGSAINEHNSHPFWRGPITLVHNGVIDNQYELLNSYGVTAHNAKPRVEVDSDSVALALSLSEDPVSTLEKVEGAYAFVWHDSRTNSLNFARNAERPMYFGHAGTVTVFASEKGMLEWLADRNNIKITEFQELPVGIMFSVTYDTEKNALVGTSTPFKAQDRKKYEATTSWVNGGANRSRSQNTSHSNYGSSGNKTLINLDEDSYSDLVKYITGKCSANGIIVGQEHDWYLDSISITNDRTVVMLKSTDTQDIKASKYLYTAGNPATVEGRVVQHVEEALLNVLLECDDHVMITCPPKAVVITDPEWTTKTTEQVYKDGGWRFIVDAEGLTVSALDANKGQYSEIFNAKKEARKAHDKIFSSRKQFNRNDLYQVTNQTEATIRDVYKGNTLVRFERHAQAQGMIIVSPVGNRSVTIMVPETNVVEAMQ